MAKCKGRESGPEPETFTEQRVRAYSVPEKGRVFYKDAKTPGLHLAVTAAGSRTYYRVGRVNGHPSRVFIGRAGSVSLGQARQRCIELNGQVASGRDPVAERRERREVPTLGKLFDDWLEYAKTRKKTWRGDMRQFNSFLAHWRSRPLSRITGVDVIAWHRDLEQGHGGYAANRVLSLLSAMFNSSHRIGYIGPNPCRLVDRFPERSRERFLQPEEMGRFFQAVAQIEQPWADLFALLLLTGGRKGNVQAMAWADIDLQGAVWHIPATSSKSGRAMAIPLVRPALEILKRRLEGRQNGCPWVFPSHRGGYVTSTWRSWGQVLDLAGIADLRLHDLRRSMGSWLAGGGASLPIVGKMLGHSTPAATAVYARLALDPVRAAAEQATAAMLACALPAPNTP